MSAIDSQGRLFGRVNLVDASVLVFALILVVLGYGTYLLFRPAKPRIESVSVVTISMQEERIARGTLLTAKLKVKGTGFNPLLRASIGESPALAFVFENPNSADVLVGDVGPNDHDLILYDGVQEVARAVNAFVRTKEKPGAASFVRLVGWFLNLTPEHANELRVGYRVPEAAPRFEILGLGPPQQARMDVRFGPSQFETPLTGIVEREGVVSARCEAGNPDDPCAYGERLAGTSAPPMISVPAQSRTLTFAVKEVLPGAPGQRARMQVRLVGGPHLSSLQVGDRDMLLDERAARITAIVSRSSPSITVVLELGLDDSRDGWRYRGRLVKPGVYFAFATERYEATGQVEALTILDGAKGGPS